MEAGVKVTCDNSSVLFFPPPRYSAKCRRYEIFFKELGSKVIVEYERLDNFRNTFAKTIVEHYQQIVQYIGQMTLLKRLIF